MTSKDEMPQDNIDYKLVSEKVWEAMQMCRAEIARLEKENATLRALLSPPVPDDVAEAIEKFNDPDYFANGKSETVKVLIRAASTPSAEVRALQKIPLSASTSGDFIAPDFIKGWNAAIDALNHTGGK